MNRDVTTDDLDVGCNVLRSMKKRVVAMFRKPSSTKTYRIVLFSSRSRKYNKERPFLFLKLEKGRTTIELTREKRFLIFYL